LRAAQPAAKSKGRSTIKIRKSKFIAVDLA
jgi:hypothetical protein